MADVNLASLNFELKIQDSGFDEQIQKIKKEAHDLNVEVSQLLDIKSKEGLISKEQHDTTMRAIAEETAAKLSGIRTEEREEARAHKANLNAIKEEAASEKAARDARVSSTKAAIAIGREQVKANKEVALSSEAAAQAAEKTKRAEQETLRATAQRMTEEARLATQEEKRATATNQRLLSQKRLNAELEREGTTLRRNHRLWNDMKNVALAYFSFESARRLVTNLVRVSAEFEKQRVSLHAILQDADGAERIFSQIKELAVQSPFQFKELVTYTKQLSAFSIPMNELYDTTKMLADVSAGLGVGMDRLVLAYGQIRSASFLRGQEVRQLTEAGIPILTELAKQFEELEGHAVSAGEVFDRISKRQVTFEMVEKVFKDMTSEGGKFYQMQEVLAETLSGKISNLTDAYQIMFAEIGEKTSGILNGTVDTLRGIAENYTEIGRRLVQLVAIYGTYKVAVAGALLLEKQAQAIAAARMGGEAISRITAMGRAVQELTVHTKAYQKVALAVSKLNPLALAAAGTAILITQIVNLTRRTSEYKKTVNSLNDAVTDYNSNITVETTNLDYLFGRLYALNSESEEYKNVRSQIINQYGQYLSDIDRENLRIKNLAGIYGTLADAIKNASMEKAIAAGREKIAEFQSGITTDIWKQFGEAMKREGLDAAKGIGKELSDYITGVISGDQLSDAAIEVGKRLRTWVKVHNAARSPWEVAQGEDKAYDFFGMRKVLEDMRGTTKELTDNFMQQIGFTEQAIKGAGTNTDKVLDTWKADLAAIVKEAEEANARLSITVDASSELLEVRQDIDKEMQDAQARYDAAMAAGEKSDAETWEKRIGFLNRMKSRLGVTDEGGGVAGTMLGASDDQTKNIVSNIQSQIRIYQMLQNTYEELMETMTDEDARQFMAFLYPQYGDMAVADYASKIHELSDELLSLGMSSDDALAAWVNLQDAFSEEQMASYRDKVKAAVEATANYKALMAEWEDFVPDSGAVNQIVRDYEKTVERIQQLRRDSLLALAQDYTVTDWENPAAGFIEQSNIINEKALAAEEAALDDAKAKAQKAIEEVYKDWRETNTDFEHLTDLTIAQLNDLKEQLAEFSLSSLDPQDLAGLEKFQMTEEQIDELLKKLKDADILKTDKQTQTKNITAWKMLAQNIVKAAKALEEYADASNNVKLAGLAKSISFIGDIVSNTMEGFKKGDVLGAVVAAAATIADYVLKAATESARLKAELAEVAHEKYLSEIEDRLKATETIFGDSWIGKIRVLRSDIRGLSKDVSDLVDRGEWLYRPYRPATSFIDALQEFADDLGLALYQENGLFDTTTLDEILKNNKYSLGKANRETINLIIKDTEKLKELYEDLDDSIKSMFSSLGSDIADSLIATLKATGDAAYDLEDVFQNLGDSIFKSMVQSFVIDEVLNKYKDEVMSWWTDETLSEADIAARIRTFAENVKHDIDVADERITAMYDAFMENSLLTVADEASDKTVGGGIKSITEDTANLLASYINAIRADVAAIRQAVVAGNTASVPAPTLAEYLTQIQANTYNNAVAAQGILENLQSMMTVTDGPALRVFM